MTASEAPSSVEVTLASAAPARRDAVRADLPEVLFVQDLCAVLGGISPSAARRAVHRGECGPYLEIGRRLAVLRDSFLSALREREITVAPTTARPLPSGVDRFA